MASEDSGDNETRELKYYTNEERREPPETAINGPHAYRNEQCAYVFSSLCSVTLVSGFGERLVVDSTCQFKSHETSFVLCSPEQRVHRMGQEGS